jgi:hypothetical protein
VAKLAEIVRLAAQNLGREDLRFVMHEPFGLKDWNDHIRGRQNSSFPPPPSLKVG